MDQDSLKKSAIALGAIEKLISAKEQEWDDFWSRTKHADTPDKKARVESLQRELKDLQRSANVLYWKCKDAGLLEDKSQEEWAEKVCTEGRDKTDGLVRELNEGVQQRAYLNTAHAKIMNASFRTSSWGGDCVA